MRWSYEILYGQHTILSLLSDFMPLTCESTLNFQFHRRTIQGQSLLYWCRQQSNIFQQMSRLTFPTSGWILDTAFIRKTKVEFHSRIDQTENYWLSFGCTAIKFCIKQFKMLFKQSKTHVWLIKIERFEKTWQWSKLKAASCNALFQPHQNVSIRVRRHLLSTGALW